MKHKRNKRVRSSFFSLGSYIIIFVLSSSAVSFCVYLLFRTVQFDRDTIIRNVQAALINILILSVLYTVIYSVGRKRIFEEPVRRILDATEKIGKGDFSVRIQPLHKGRGKNEYDVIIEDLNKLTQELASVETLRTDFIANVSHELKTPLSVVKNYAVLLQHPTLSTEERIEYSGCIVQATDRLSALITNILRLNSLENQTIFPLKSSYDLGEQIREAILLYEPSWEKKNIELEIDIEDDVIISADRELMELIWTNLISNAIKYCREGGRIFVDMKRRDGRVSVTVSDNGVGMTKEVKEHIFDKFYQGDTSHSVRGNGLGLALVKRIADITGAEINVTSVPEKGSTFEVLLPE